MINGRFRVDGHMSERCWIELIMSSWGKDASVDMVVANNVHLAHIMGFSSQPRMFLCAGMLAWFSFCGFGVPGLRGSGLGISAFRASGVRGECVGE